MALADPKKFPPNQPPLNGPIHVECTTMRNVLASAMEPPTPAVANSAPGDVFSNDNIRQRRSRAIDMRFYWFRDRVRQVQFLMYWMAG